MKKVVKAKKKPTPPLFYEYRQNNSGGSFKKPAMYVFVQAMSTKEADEIAQRHDVYFDYGYTRDCSCCGTRWDHAEDYEGKKTLKEHTDPIKQYQSKMTTSWAVGARIPIYIAYYLDGKVVIYPKASKRSNQLVLRTVK